MYQHTSVITDHTSSPARYRHRPGIARPDGEKVDRGRVVRRVEQALCALAAGGGGTRRNHARLAAHQRLIPKQPRGRLGRAPPPVVTTEQA